MVSQQCKLLECMRNLKFIINDIKHFHNWCYLASVFHICQCLFDTSSGHVQKWELDCEESWLLKNYCFWTVVLEKTLESPLDCKEIQPVHSKGDQSWGSLEGLMLKLKLQNFGHLMWRVDSLERLWCWEGLGTGGEGDDRGGDGWMASLTQWTWVWVNPRNWLWTGRPGVLRFMGSQRVGHDWATELNWTEPVDVEQLKFSYTDVKV